MSSPECKPSRAARRATRSGAWALRACVPATVLLQISACTLSAPTRTISLSDLESAPLVPVERLGRTIVADVDATEAMYTSLAPRLGIYRVLTPEQWRAFQGAARISAPVISSGRGTIIGIVSRAGRPLAGGWPIRVEQVRVVDGAALVTARFASGSYLPDGLSYVDTVYVDEPIVVLALEINDVRYYPQ